MKNVAKYNIFKGVSTLLTLGTPAITLLCCGDFFVHRSDTAMSAAGILVMIITLFFAKDKLAENFKMPAPFILCAIGLVLVVMIENIIYPIKMVLITTLIATVIDEFTFKMFYKKAERKLPPEHVDYKKFGFIFTTTDNLEAKS